ncbi:hypothetical protein TNCV_338251 [Trichonephila clavipes]|nr:hypothetical protein TNCV_338251 [Trichonephila clavipes]
MKREEDGAQIPGLSNRHPPAVCGSELGLISLTCTIIQRRSASFNRREMLDPICQKRSFKVESFGPSQSFWKRPRLFITRRCDRKLQAFLFENSPPETKQTALKKLAARPSYAGICEGRSWIANRYASPDRWSRRAIDLKESFETSGRPSRVPDASLPLEVSWKHRIMTGNRLNVIIEWKRPSVRERGIVCHIQRKVSPIYKEVLFADARAFHD